MTHELNQTYNKISFKNLGKKHNPKFIELLIKLLLVSEF